MKKSGRRNTVPQLKVEITSNVDVIVVITSYNHYGDYIIYAY